RIEPVSAEYDRLRQLLFSEALRRPAHPGVLTPPPHHPPPAPARDPPPRTAPRAPCAGRPAPASRGGSSSLKPPREGRGHGGMHQGADIAPEPGDLAHEA